MVPSKRPLSSRKFVPSRPNAITNYFSQTRLGPQLSRQSPIISFFHGPITAKLGKKYPEFKKVGALIIPSVHGGRIYLPEEMRYFGGQKTLNYSRLKKALQDNRYFDGTSLETHDHFTSVASKNLWFKNLVFLQGLNGKTELDKEHLQEVLHWALEKKLDTIAFAVRFLEDVKYDSNTMVQGLVQTMAENKREYWLTLQEEDTQLPNHDEMLRAAHIRFPAFFNEAFLDYYKEEWRKQSSILKAVLRVALTESEPPSENPPKILFMLGKDYPEKFHTFIEPWSSP